MQISTPFDLFVIIRRMALQFKNIRYTYKICNKMKSFHHRRFFQGFRRKFDF